MTSRWNFTALNHKTGLNVWRSNYNYCYPPQPRKNLNKCALSARLDCRVYSPAQWHGPIPHRVLLQSQDTFQPTWWLQTYWACTESVLYYRMCKSLMHALYWTYAFDTKTQFIYGGPIWYWISSFDKVNYALYCLKAIS